MGEFAKLDDRFRNRWGQDYRNFSLRIRRATSWGRRGDVEEEKGDPDTAFIFYWIAFNALYAKNPADRSKTERDNLRDYLTTIVDLDKQRSIYNAIQDQSTSAYELFKNEYVFDEFWDCLHGISTSVDWRRIFERQRDSAVSSLESGKRDFAVLRGIFDRLYVLRNQVLHGSATWGSRVNRDQVTGGAKLMKLLLPRFVDLMLDDAEHAEDVDDKWGKPYYPVVNKPADWD